jgi:hypothetical protein
MHPSRISTAEQALAYITDCTLATVCDMAMKKSPPKGEFSRQISIAQTAVDAMKNCKVDFSGTRAEKVCGEFNGSVAAWAESFRDYWKPNTPASSEKQ